VLKDLFHISEQVAIKEMDTDSKGFLKREINRYSRRPDANMSPSLLDTELLRVEKKVEVKPSLLDSSEMSFDKPVDKSLDNGCQLVSYPPKK
jgi:hypothetical protein